MVSLLLIHFGGKDVQAGKGTYTFRKKQIGIVYVPEKLIFRKKQIKIERLATLSLPLVLLSSLPLVFLSIPIFPG